MVTPDRSHPHYAATVNTAQADKRSSPSHQNFVASEQAEPLGVSGPGGAGVGGQSGFPVQIYALGRGVAIKGQRGDLAGREGSFELESHSRTFVFFPPWADRAQGLVTPIKRHVTAVFLQIKAKDEEDLVEVSDSGDHSDLPQKTTILHLPMGFGKTTIADALMERLGCEAVVDDWCVSHPLTPNALHLTSDDSLFENGRRRLAKPTGLTPDNNAWAFKRRHYAFTPEHLLKACTDFVSDALDNPDNHPNWRELANSDPNALGEYLASELSARLPGGKP